MTRDVRHPLVVFRFVAGLVIPAVIVVHLLGPTPWTAALLLVAIGHWLSHVWFVRTFEHRPLAETMVMLCAAQFATAVAFTIVEPWLLHLTPLVCLSPVIAATRWVDEDMYRRLGLAAITVIVGITVIARAMGGTGVVFAESSATTRSVIAVLFTPTLAGFVGWMAWRNQRTMLEQASSAAESQRRLERADEFARQRFDDSSDSLRAELGNVQASLSAATNSSRELDDLKQRVQALVENVRDFAHGLGPQDFALDVEHDIAELEELLDCFVVVESSLGERPAIVDSLIRQALLELHAASPASLETVRVRRSGPQVIVDVETLEPLALLDLSLDTRDRVEALGGWSTSQPLGHHGLQLGVAAEGPSRPLYDRTGIHDLRSDLRLGLVFPIVAFVVGVMLSLTFLQGTDMYVVTAMAGLLYVAPCAVTSATAERYPRASLVTFVLSNWVAAIAIADQLRIVKWFGAIALLVPLLLLMPYIRSRTYTALALGTSIVTAVTIAVARLGTQIESAGSAPGPITDIVVILFVPLTCAVLILLAQRNHRQLSNSAAIARSSRRDLIEASDEVRRAIERDLHDGTQQRLVSAALQLQVAARKPAAERATTLSLAALELRRADRALGRLRVGGSLPVELVEADLKTALADLAASSATPIHVNIPTLRVKLEDHLASSLWFCCTEAITNAVKHAGAHAEIFVDVREHGAAVEFSIRDDGCGFDGDTDRDEGGLANIRERCSRHGGSVEVVSQLGHGTAVHGVLPVERQPELR